MSYYLCENIHVPLVALIDYRGFRLVAESLLPIKKSSLCYGSSDGGHTVFDSNSTCNTWMEKAAEKINIKKHRCGLSFGKKFLSAPVDIGFYYFIFYFLFFIIFISYFLFFTFYFLFFIFIFYFYFYL